MKLLIVEDEPAGRTLLELMLEGMHQVLAVGSVEEAQRELAAGQWDLLLTDYKLPGKSGLDLIHSLEREGSTMPIIMMTGQGSKDAALDSIKTRVRTLLTKPFTRDDLLAALADIQQTS